MAEKTTVYAVYAFECGVGRRPFYTLDDAKRFADKIRKAHPFENVVIFLETSQKIDF
jgi:hypothetical protein